MPTFFDKIQVQIRKQSELSLEMGQLELQVLFFIVAMSSNALELFIISDMTS